MSPRLLTTDHPRRRYMLEKLANTALASRMSRKQLLSAAKKLISIKVNEYVAEDRQLLIRARKELIINIQDFDAITGMDW